jgi:hypothetical protein
MVQCAAVKTCRWEMMDPPWEFSINFFESSIKISTKLEIYHRKSWKIIRRGLLLWQCQLDMELSFSWWFQNLCRFTKPLLQLNSLHSRATNDSWFSSLDFFVFPWATVFFETLSWSWLKNPLWNNFIPVDGKIFSVCVTQSWDYKQNSDWNFHFFRWC